MKFLTGVLGPLLLLALGVSAKAIVDVEVLKAENKNIHENVKEIKGDLSTIRGDIKTILGKLK